MMQSLGGPNGLVSIVVPAYNEAESLPALVDQITSVAQASNLTVEILIIDDGSTDNTWDVVQSLAASSNLVRGIRFRKNFGKAAALAAGFDASRGSLLITMDADLQDDPKEIPALLQKLAEGVDAVSGWKKVRHDPWHKTFPSKIFNGLVGWATGVRLHDHNCGLKAYRREIFDEVKLYGELHRFVPVLAAARGWRVTEIPVEHHPRKFGKSKYGVRRFIKGLLDLVTVYFLISYRQRPQHLLGTWGLVCLSFGSIALVALSVAWCVSRMSDQIADVHLHERAIFYFSICAILLGFQLVAVGILAELITANQRPDQQPYSISAKTIERSRPNLPTPLPIPPHSPLPSDDRAPS